MAFIGRCVWGRKQQWLDTNSMAMRIFPRCWIDKIALAGFREHDQECNEGARLRYMRERVMYVCIYIYVYIYIYIFIYIYIYLYIMMLMMMMMMMVMIGDGDDDVKIYEEPESPKEGLGLTHAAVGASGK